MLVWNHGTLMLITFLSKPHSSTCYRNTRFIVINSCTWFHCFNQLTTTLHRLCHSPTCQHFHASSKVTSLTWAKGKTWATRSYQPFMGHMMAINNQKWAIEGVRGIAYLEAIHSYSQEPKQNYYPLPLPLSPEIQFSGQTLKCRGLVLTNHSHNMHG